MQLKEEAKLFNAIHPLRMRRSLLIGSEAQGLYFANRQQIHSGRVRIQFLILLVRLPSQFTLWLALMLAFF
jgi:hypothetical protein